MPPRNVAEDPAMLVSSAPSSPPVSDSATAMVAPEASNSSCTLRAETSTNDLLRPDGRA